MILIEAFFKFATVGALIGLSLLILRDGRHIPAFRFALLLNASLISLYFVTGDPQLSLSGPTVIPLRLFDMMTFVFLWWFGLALFNDEFKLGTREWSVALAFIGLSAPSRLYYLGFDVPHVPQLNMIVYIFSFTLCLHLAYTALSGHREDLIESRRRMRIKFAVTLSVMVLISISMERLAPELGYSVEWSMYFIYLFTLPISLWGIFWLTKLNTQTLAFTEKKKTFTDEIMPHLQEARSRLIHIMERERGFAEHGLTIGKLSTKVGIPPHQLRSLINQSMGYRNYSAFLNHYRIADVKSALADPGNSRTPVISLALEAGFSSLAPFNKAFKDIEGLPPSDYRQKKLAEAIASTPQN